MLQSGCNRLLPINNIARARPTNTELPVFISPNLVNSISSGFDLRREPGLIQLQHSTSLTDTQTIGRHDRDNADPERYSNLRWAVPTEYGVQYYM